MGDVLPMIKIIIGWFLGVLTYVFAVIALDSFHDWRARRRRRILLERNRREKGSNWIELNGVLYGFSAQNRMIRASDLTENEVKVLGGMPKTRMDVP